MPHFSHLGFLTEASNVKIITSPAEGDESPLASRKIILKIQKTDRMSDKYYGFHLTKSKWDPYPWISYVESNTPADLAGLKAGDCLLEVGDTDLLGLRIQDIASLIRSEESAFDVNLSVWRYSHQQEEQDDIGLALKGPLPDVARNLANALSETVRALECPICLESAVPPVSQCVHGHILCVICRPKTTRCPVCRVRLGQGRCLLADKLHRVFRDTFYTGNNETALRINASDRSCNLRDQLFGKNGNRRKTPVAPKNNCNALKPRQFLLARLLLGDRQKAASADNLTRVSETPEETTISVDRVTTIDNLRVQLSLNDRAKSASTGELPRDSKSVDEESSTRIAESSHELSVTNINQSLSLPQTPVWGGSTDSCVSLACPLLQSCREITTSDTLLEHIKSHTQVPQIHFYSGSVRIPLPLPFGRDALYIFHHGDDVFFFQCGEETAWMTYPAKTSYAYNTWEWTLHAWGDNETKVRLRRRVASLEEPVTLSSQHIAPLPNTLSLRIINIQVVEYQVHDRLCV